VAHSTARFMELDRPRPGLKDLERWGSATTAAALFALGISRRSVPGVFLMAAALPLAYRSVAGRWPLDGVMPSRATDTRAALSGHRGIHARESVRIEKPVTEVYRFFRRFENLPQFMINLERVTELPDGRSHWVAQGPGGTRVEWYAEIINEIENHVIGWRSLPDSDVVTAGSVMFAPVRGGSGTQLSVHLQYAPPGGRAGALIATLAGKEPSQTIREDLRRLKQLLEAGEIPRATAHGHVGSWR
jgi:uncharacterized membrane protein